MRADLRLYVIVDPAIAQERDLAELASAAAAGGATLIQYRDKTGDTLQMVKQARRIRQALAGSDVPFLINDRVDVALAASADGVHLGQNDMSPRDARRVMGAAAIIGRTVKTMADADALSYEPVDYACIGGVFATTSKHNASVPLGLEGASALHARIRRIAPNLPLGAIAGINLHNVADVIGAGFNGVAVISAITGADDPRRAAAELRHAIDRALETSRMPQQDT